MTDDTGRALVQRICLACLPLLQATGAMVSTTTRGASDGRVFATDHVAARIDELQFELGEGPGIDAVRAGGAVLVSDLATSSAHRRWPAFVPAALSCGAAALWSFPLLIGAIQLGVLAVYHVEPARLNRDQLDRAFRLAEAASFGLLDVAAGYSADVVYIDAETGMAPAFHRAEVYQASGMVSVQLGVSLETALARLRAYAFAQDRPISEIANDVVARKLRLEADNV